MSTLLPDAPDSLSRAAAALARGELVAFPTETVYGLGAAADDDAAIAEVYRRKGRPAEHPLIVHLPSANSLWQWADREAQRSTGVAPELVDELVAACWPGPLTLVLHAAKRVSRRITGGQDTVALRTPGHPTALALLAAYGGALVAPSANRYGQVSPTTAQHVLAEFPGELLVIDGGPTEFGLESTILDLSTPRPRLLRPGALALARLEELLGSPVERVAAGREDAAGEKLPRVPGSVSRHYSPRAKVRLVPAAALAPGVSSSAPSANAGGGVKVAVAEVEAGFIVRSGSPATAPGGARPARLIELPADPRGYAAGLYAALRRLDAAGVEEIVIERPPLTDDWLAVNDRLARAAAQGEPGSANEAETPEPGPYGERPQVAIVMGSTSDWETMRHADELLERFGVARTCQVVSAHRTPQRMAEFAAGAAAAGYRVIIAGAGGAAHLPGMVAAQTHLPVLGVPVLSSALNGVDSLLSQVQMPRGVPVGTLAIGPAGALNAALLAVAILALQDERLERELLAYREAQTAAAEGSTLPTAAFRR